MVRRLASADQAPVLRDVAGMLCSFRYAADTALARQVELVAWIPTNRAELHRWAELLAALGERGVPERLPRLA